MTIELQAQCQRCDSPFEPVEFTLPAPGSAGVKMLTKFCPSCAGEIHREEAAAARAAKELRVKPLSDLLPTPGEPITTDCRICGQPFQAETSVFQGDKRVKERVIYPTVCDECASLETMAKPGPINPTQEDRRRKMWVGMTGIRYADFKASELPEAIRPHVERVMSWTPQPQGIGLVGAPRIGKSPLIYALGQSLFVAGHDVMPTTGLEFQRKYQRSFDKGEADAWATYLKDCESCEVLLIDDADKLNLTAGVEAEYYGMLEHRRNWQLPVLCTLNLTGDDFKALARDRSDRAAAIVERLRDVCQFIPVP